MSPTRVTFGNTCWKAPDAPLGGSFGGGRLICRSGGVGWIVAPANSEVSRGFSSFNNAVTTAQSITGCTGWFVPTISQLQNPGYTCRIYWDSYSLARYGASDGSPSFNCHVNFANGSSSFYVSENQVCVRAFRCVTY